MNLVRELEARPLPQDPLLADLRREMEEEGKAGKWVERERGGLGIYRACGVGGQAQDWKSVIRALRDKTTRLQPSNPSSALRPRPRGRAAREGWQHSGRACINASGLVRRDASRARFERRAPTRAGAKWLFGRITTLSTAYRLVHGRKNQSWRLLL